MGGAVALSFLAVALVGRPHGSAFPAPEGAGARPASPAATVAEPSGGLFLDGVGSGWSVVPDTTRAVSEAYRAARGADTGSELTLVFYNPDHDPKRVRDALLEGGARRVLGETTYEGVLTPSGYRESATGVLGLLAADLEEYTVGVGGASYEEGGPAEAVARAYHRALEDAGLGEAGAGGGAPMPAPTPAMVLLCVTLPHEEDVLSALEALTGPGVPVMGGTAAGSFGANSRERISNWSVIANERVIENGLGVALLFGRECAWFYGGGFRRTSRSGVVTRAERRTILEIDGRPAAEVYDEWLGGGVEEALARGENIVRFCTLYPVCRSYDGGDQVIRVWPGGTGDPPGCLRTGSTVAEGDEVFLSEGNWNILLNHFASVPDQARRLLDEPPLAGLMWYCGGALACIPETDRPQMAHLVGRSLGRTPWIGVFTWGEQGSVSGAGNLHANLQAGIVLLPSPTKP